MTPTLILFQVSNNSKSSLKTKNSEKNVINSTLKDSTKSLNV